MSCNNEKVKEEKRKKEKKKHFCFNNLQASEMLRVIQLNTLEDRSINDKRDWDQAVRFLETSVKEKLQSTEQILRDMLGPNRKERWFYWQSQTEEQQKRTAVKNELDKILYTDKVRYISRSYRFYIYIYICCFCIRNIHLHSVRMSLQPLEKICNAIPWK